MKNNFPIFKIAVQFSLIASMFLTGVFVNPTVTMAASPCDLGVYKPAFNQYPETLSNLAGCLSGVGSEFPIISGNVHGAGVYASSFNAQVGDSITLRVYMNNSADADSGAVMHDVAYNTAETDSANGTSHVFTTTLTASNALNSGDQGSITINTPAGATLQVTSGSLSGTVGDMHPYFENNTNNDKVFYITLTVVKPVVVIPPTVTITTSGATGSTPNTFCIYTNGHANDTITYSVTGSPASSLAGDKILWSSTKNGIPTGEFNNYDGQNLDANGLWSGAANASLPVGSWTKTIGIYDGTTVLASATVSFVVQDCTPVVQVTPLTASLTANGQPTITVPANTNVTYVWNSTGAVSANSADQIYNTVTGQPVSYDACGVDAQGVHFNSSGPFVFNSLTGSLSVNTAPCQVGYTYVLKYSAVDASGNVVSSTAKIVVVGPTVVIPPTVSITTSGATGSTPNTFCIYTNGHANDTITYSVTGSPASSLAGDKILWSSTKNGIPTGESNDYYNENLDSNGSWSGPAIPSLAVGSWTKTVGIYDGTTVLASATVSFVVQDCTPGAVTASLTVNGSHAITIPAGTFVDYAWSSTNAIAATASTTRQIYLTAGHTPVASDACGNLSGTDTNILYGTGGTALHKLTLDCQIGYTYTFTYGVVGTTGQYASDTASITIVAATNATNNPPVITLIGANPFSMTAGTPFIDPGAIALDVEDGNITSKIVVTGNVNAAVAGTYTLTYSVTDSGGLSTSTTRTVQVNPVVCTVNCGGGSNNTAPTITIIGANPMYLTLGQVWNDPGATAQDAEDGNLTSKIVVTGTVNTAVIGTTTITYTVTDSGGLTASKTRTVVVSNSSTGGGSNTGQINVCLVIADQNNTIATSSYGLPSGLFTLNIGTSTTIASSTSTIVGSKTWSSGTFNPNKKTIMSLNDSDCVTFSSLPFSDYYYTQLAVTGANFNVAKYNDQLVNNISDFSLYSPELFNTNPADDASRNLTTDGMVTVNSANTNQTIYILEKYTTATTSSPSPTASLTANGSHSITVVPNTNITYVWASTNGVTASSTDQIYNTATNQPVANDACVDVNGNHTNVSGPFNFNSLSGTMVGTTAPCQLGYTYVLTYSVANANGVLTHDTATVIVATSTPIVNTIAITSPLTATGVVGTGFSYQITATSNSTSTINYSVSTSTLPAGLTFSGDTISGTPTIAGTYSVTLNAANGLATTSAVLVITINPQSTGGGGGCTSNCGGGGGGGGGCTSNCGGGGGGSGNNTLLAISNEKVVEISTGVALVTWTTNIPATTQVGYDTNSFASIVNKIAPFGYATSSVFDGTLVIEHSVTVPIQHGVTYYFRPVSGDGISAVFVGNEISLTPGGATTIIPPVITPTNPIVVTPVPPVTNGGGNGGNACVYLYDYLHIGQNNSVIEVEKLQRFLRDYEGDTTLQVSGTFDQPTFDAVENFQVKYTQDILAPWATTTPTGFVYIFTKQKINQIYCANPNGIQVAPPTIEQINAPTVLPTNEVGFNERFVNFAGAAFAFPWNWIKGLFAPNSCSLFDAYFFGFVDLLILLLLMLIAWLLYDKRKKAMEEAKRLEEVNRQLDLTK